MTEEKKTQKSGVKGAGCGVGGATHVRVHGTGAWGEEEESGDATGGRKRMR